jgi:hypothetical protein
MNDRIFLQWLITCFLVMGGVDRVVFGEESLDQPIPIEAWTLQVPAASMGRFSKPPRPTAVGVQLDRAMPEEDWKISLWSNTFGIEIGFEYTLTFDAKSAAPRPITLFAAQSNAPYRLISSATSFDLKGNWTSYAFRFRPSASEPAGRLQISLGASEADVEMRDIKLERRAIPPTLPERANSPPLWTLSAPAETRAKVAEDRNELGTLSVEIGQDTTKNPWEMNVHRAGYTFDAGKEYVARFRARASEARQIEFLALRDRTPWTLVAAPEAIPLTTRWEDFEIPFSPIQNEPRGMVQFNLGGSAAGVQIERFDLAETKPDQDIDQFRFLRNAWSLTVAPENRAQLERPIHGGSAFRIRIDQALTLERWHINFLYSPIRIIEARNYLLRFRVRGDGDRVISVRLDDSATGNSLGVFKLIKITPSWQEVEIPFRSLGETNQARLIFELGGSDIDVELANVALRIEPRSVISLDRTRTVIVNVVAVSAAVGVVALLVGRDFRRRRRRANELAESGHLY